MTASPISLRCIIGEKTEIVLGTLLMFPRTSFLPSVGFCKQLNKAYLQFSFINITLDAGESADH